jgi:hypothetical protein
MTQKEIEEKHYEIMEKVSKMHIKELETHLIDHAVWYAEYADDSGEEYTDAYWQMQTEAAILTEAANRLRAINNLGEMIDEEENNDTK